MSDDTEKAAEEILEDQETLEEQGAEEEIDEEPVEVPDRNSELMSILEAAVFASNEILSGVRLKSILPGQPDGRTIRRLVRSINEKLQRERHPFEVAEVGGGYQFRTVPYYHPWVQQVFKEKAARRLSIQALECLAITAYKQPLTKAEIEAIRGVTSDGALKTLLEKRLVTIAGRSDKPGHPLLYGTTPFFLQYFGLNKLIDLPKIEEFEAMAREKMDDLSEEELQQIEELTAEEEEVAAAEDAGEGDEEQAEVEAQEEPQQPEPAQSEAEAEDEANGGEEAEEQGLQESELPEPASSQNDNAEEPSKEAPVNFDDDAVELESEDPMENAEQLEDEVGGDDDEDDITTVLATGGARVEVQDDDSEGDLPAGLSEVVAVDDTDESEEEDDDAAEEDEEPQA